VFVSSKQIIRRRYTGRPVKYPASTSYSALVRQTLEQMWASVSKTLALVTASGLCLKKCTVERCESQQEGAARNKQAGWSGCLTSTEVSQNLTWNAWDHALASRYADASCWYWCTLSIIKQRVDKPSGLTFMTQFQSSSTLSVREL